LTTPPYPIELVEEISSNSGTPKQGFQPWLESEEEVTSTALPISGVFKTILVTTQVLPEDIESNALPISGILVDRLIRITAPIEELESNALPISGNLGDPLVRYENWPLGYDAEDLESAGLPISGALT
jgi:hypothetical protein